MFVFVLISKFVDVCLFVGRIGFDPQPETSIPTSNPCSATRAGGCIVVEPRLHSGYAESQTPDRPKHMWP